MWLSKYILRSLRASIMFFGKTLWTEQNDLFRSFLKHIIKGRVFNIFLIKVKQSLLLLASMLWSKWQNHKGLFYFLRGRATAA